MSEKKKAKLILDYLKKEGEDYTDGEVEDQILDLLDKGSFEVEKKNILLNEPSWPLLYHLSPVRENVLNWYPFNKKASLLEVGSGCGALTGLFTEKVESVVAVELTEKRATITAKRWKDKENLTVYAGNLNDIKFEGKFDYVTCMGVLEYAGKYTDSDNPFRDFLIKLKSFLKEGGILILALENKFGIKYWAGAKEDHTGKFFDSLEGYPDFKGIQTFGKKEIADLLNESGFKNQQFYYPLPDYKLPVEIFSEEYKPTLLHNLKKGIYPYVDLAQGREYLFNEKLVSDNIIKNENFDFFANSFLIFSNKA